VGRNLKRHVYRVHECYHSKVRAIIIGDPDVRICRKTSIAYLVRKDAPQSSGRLGEGCMKVGEVHPLLVKCIKCVMHMKIEAGHPATMSRKISNVSSKAYVYQLLTLLCRVRHPLIYLGGKHMADLLKQEQTGVVQRALQMASEGRVRSVSEIQITMMREGYEQVPQYLVGASIRRQIRAIIKSSRQPQ
jgi:hypothetical protein